MKIVPSKGYVAVKQVDEQATSPSGLSIGKDVYYQVVAVGAEVEISVRDKVLIHVVASKFSLRGIDYYMVKDEDIVGQLV
jgi:hypothetical protein